jgi:antitoxin component of RelBE/YafQ-DinJ toxin-antitoxin module
MRIILIGHCIVMASALAIATPASALGLGDLAKVVLGGNSVLKKGEQKCGSSLGLTKDDSLAMTFARAAVERSLPISEFTALDKSAEVDAANASNAPAFCNETKKKKSGMMKAITKAGKSIIKQKALGGLGI